jgi:hypothetical protein
MKSGFWTFVAGIGLLVPASIGLLLTGVPSLFSPFPVLTIVPAFLLSPRVYHAAVLIPTLLFFAWNPQLFRGEGQIPKRSLVLLGLAAACNVFWFVGGWQYGIKYQGPQHVYFVCVANLLWLVLLCVAMLRYWRAPSFVGNMLFHWTLFSWLAWYAFPYLGELP